jgi:hypothetical protein
MSKISKQKLKQIVKECIVEILAEGLGQELVEGVSHTRRSTVPSNPASAPRQQVQQKPALIEAVNHAAGGDKVLSSILADTAATTFQQQSKYSNANGDPLFGGASSKEELTVATATPEELFGNAVISKWEDLAFTPAAKKHQ